MQSPIWSWFMIMMMIVGQMVVINEALPTKVFLGSLQDGQLDSLSTANLNSNNVVKPSDLFTTIPRTFGSFSTSTLNTENNDQMQDIVRPINNMFNRVANSETAAAIDTVGSSFVSMFGNFVETLGNIVSNTVGPSTIDKVSERVGSAVDNGGKKVVIVMNGIRTGMEGTHKDAINNFKESFINTEVQDSLRELQDRVVVTLGKILGIAYQNADEIDTAVANTIKSLAGLSQGGTQINRHTPSLPSTSNTPSLPSISNTLSLQSTSDTQSNLIGGDFGPKKKHTKFETLSDAEIREFFPEIE